jgi:3-hydroxyisobutyrate dehydrogenase-like beta-hydroxyacid dehydrogenase
MVNRLLDAKYQLTVWNRTPEKAAPLAQRGVKIVDKIADLQDADAVFTMLSTGKDLLAVCFDENGLAPKSASKRPQIIVDCSTIGLEESRDIRAKLAEVGVDYLAAPVSGNPKCVMTGRLSSVVSGSADAFEKVRPVIETYAASGVSYVGEGELARICKVAHNVLLGATLANLIEVTLMAQRGGRSAPRLPQVHQQQRHGFSVLALQVARARQSRLDDHAHSRPDAQGPGSRPRIGPQACGCGADHRRGSGSLSGPYQRRERDAGRGETRKIRLRRPVRDLGSGRRRHP